MLELLKKMLDNPPNDDILSYYIELAIESVMAYTRRPKAYCETVLKSSIIELVKVSLNKEGFEGVSSQTSSGASETYIDGMPEEVKQRLRSHRLLKEAENVN